MSEQNPAEGQAPAQQQTEVHVDDSGDAARRTRTSAGSRPPPRR